MAVKVSSLNNNTCISKVIVTLSIVEQVTGADKCNLKFPH